MKQFGIGNMNFGYKNLFFVGFIFIVGVHAVGCATPKAQNYDKISFSWTSDHHLPPDQRFLSLNVAPEAVDEGIQKWVSEKKGEIIEKNDNCSTIVQLQPNCENNFLATQGITKKEWDAYDQNTYRKWEEGEWEKLQQMSKSQVEYMHVPDRPSICIKAQLGKRQKQIAYTEQVGTTTFYQQTFIYTKNGPIPGALIPVQTPRYETRTTTMSFASQIHFFIFADQGLTRIYAVGAPFDVGASVKAAYGASTRHSCWPMITGKDEASLITEAYTYLKTAYP